MTTLCDLSFSSDTDCITDVFNVLTIHVCILISPLSLLPKRIQKATSSGVRPLSAAHVHACMSLWLGEGCALHFNIPFFTGDVCFSLFLFFDFSFAVLVSHYQCLYLLTVLWDWGITLCKIPLKLRHRSFKLGTLLNTKPTQCVLP